MSEELYNHAKHVIDYGISKGADQVEAYVVFGSSKRARLERNAISQFTETATSGLGVRVVKDNAVGMTSTTIFSEESIENIVKNAISLASVSPSDPNFKTLPLDLSEAPDVEGLVDNTLRELAIEDFSEIMLEALEESKVREDVIVSGNFTTGFGERYILNSLGVDRHSSTTTIGGFLGVKIQDGDDVGSAFYFDSANSLEKFDHLEVGKKAGERALKMLGAQKIETKMLPILLDPQATYGTISSIIPSGINAFNVFNKTAFFVDKIGDSIASDKLTIADDPFYPHGIDSSPFDDEGVVPKKLTLIQDGVLQTYLTDSYSAPLVGLENTGHASRGSFSTRPAPSPYAMQIKEGDSSKDEMMEDMKEGIFLLASAITPQGGTPTISSQINQGFYVRDGEIQYPVKNAVIGSNVFDLLNKIDLVSKETENRKGHIAPWIKFEELTTSGGK